MSVASICAGVSLAALFAAANVTFAKFTDDEVTFRLLRKETPLTIYSDGDMNPSVPHRLVTDKGIFVDDTGPFAGKLRAGMIDRGLKEGGTYTCRVYGVDIPDVEIYRNVTGCKPAP